MRNEIEQQFRLDGKTILVTGASSGIGRQTAIHISALGGKVVATGRSETKLADTFRLLQGTGHQQIAADLTKSEDIKKIADQVGQLDGVVHSAGIVVSYPARFIDQKTTAETFDINYNAPVFLMTALFKAKKIKGPGSVVFISSFSAMLPYPLGGLYVSSKAALEAYSKVLAIERANIGLRSNCVCPALVKTDIYNQTFNVVHDPQAEEKRKAYETLYPLGIGKPEDVANAIVFLLGDASKWITGQSIILDGGYLLGLLSNTANAAK